MSNFDDKNESPESNVDAPAAGADAPSAPAPASRRRFATPWKIAGAVSAVAAAVVLAFGAGVWAGSEFFEGHEHEHSESRGSDRDDIQRRHEDHKTHEGSEHRFRDDRANDRESDARTDRSSAPGASPTATATPTLPPRP